MQKLLTALLVAAAPVMLVAQETRPVPKDSVRVSVPGCARGYIFTAGPAAEDRPGGTVVPPGTHLRMTAPKTTMAEIKGNGGSRIEITGLMKKGQAGPEGIAIGRGVRVVPGTGGPAVGLGGGFGSGSPVNRQIVIDVEGWRHLPGDCPR